MRCRTFVGAIAQLEERYIRIVEAEGSNPFRSTRLYVALCVMEYRTK